LTPRRTFVLRGLVTPRRGLVTPRRGLLRPQRGFTPRRELLRPQRGFTPRRGPRRGCRGRAAGARAIHTGRRPHPVRPGPCRWGTGTNSYHGATVDLDGHQRRGR